MPDLILVRGISGSGKSTYAKGLRGYVHLEADEYFKGWFGRYNFDPRKLAEAHAWCRNECRNALRDGRNVVVANTFTQRWELQPYIDMANEMGVTYEIITMRGRYKNVHGVPDSVIQAQSDRWED